MYPYNQQNKKIMYYQIRNLLQKKAKQIDKKTE